MATPLTISQLMTPASQQSWLETLFAAAVTLGLPTTSWRSGDPERVILTMLSFLAQREDALASAYNQGGFLDFAATGTVTLEVPDGGSVVVPVSPDPSDPTVNPNGDVTLLDQLTTQNYDTPRILQTSAGGNEAILNTSASTYGPFAIGSFHVSNPTTKATYANSADVTIPPSSIAGTAVTNAVTSGGLIKLTTSTAHGLVAGDPVFVTGVTGTTEANGAWYVAAVPTTTTFTLAGSIFTNAYLSGGTVYEPTVVAVTADIAGSASSSFDGTGSITIHTVTTSVTSLIGVSVDNLDPFTGTDIENNVALARRAKLKLQSITTNGVEGAYEYYALSATRYAPLLVPPKAVATPITRVVVKDAFGKVYAFLANAAGAPGNDDVVAVDLVLKAYAKPLGIVLTTRAATEQTVALVADVWLPSAFATAAVKATLVAALQTYFRVLPIGGLSDPAGSPAYTNVLPWSDVLGAIYEAARTAQVQLDRVTLTLNSGTADISLPVSTSLAKVAVLSPATPTINLHAT